jgi:hypothetical protein
MGLNPMSAQKQKPTACLQKKMGSGEQTVKQKFNKKWVDNKLNRYIITLNVNFTRA